MLIVCSPAASRAKLAFAYRALRKPKENNITYGVIITKGPLIYYYLLNQETIEALAFNFLHK